VDAIEVWGDGLTDSFLPCIIDECIEATRRLMESDFMGPVNVGSEEMVTINQLVDTAAKVAGKVVQKRIISMVLLVFVVATQTTT
jgi:GDP-D-mannose 3', 5'-epimerase